MLGFEFWRQPTRAKDAYRDNNPWAITALSDLGTNHAIVRGVDAISSIPHNLDRLYLHLSSYLQPVGVSS